MPDISSTLASIDAATGCQWCEGPLGDSPSGDFCGETCQARWAAARVGAPTKSAGESRYCEMDVAHGRALIAAAERGVRVAVCAQDHWQAERFRRTWALPRHQAIYATSVRAAHGVGDHEVVILDGFWSNWDAHEIWESLKIQRRRSDPRRTR